MEDLREVGARIRELREICGYSQESLARELAVDADTYRHYEETGTDIPISVIFQIAKKFGVEYSEIISGESAKLHTYQIVRAGEGQTADRYYGYEYRNLAYRYNKKLMMPMVVTLEKTDKRTSLSSHAGEEFNYVLQGDINIVMGDKEFVLHPGDSIYFNATIQHGQNCCSEGSAAFLVVLAE